MTCKYIINILYQIKYIKEKEWLQCRLILICICIFLQQNKVRTWTNNVQSNQWVCERIQIDYNYRELFLVRGLIKYFFYLGTKKEQQSPHLIALKHASPNLKLAHGCLRQSAAISWYYFRLGANVKRRESKSVATAFITRVNAWRR